MWRTHAHNETDVQHRSDQGTWNQATRNWADFLYNKQTNQIEFLDFGAARAFGINFVTDYVQVLRALVNKDRDAVRWLSVKLGFLTELELKEKNDRVPDRLGDGVGGSVFSQR